MMWKSRFMATAGVTAAMLASTALGASPAGAVTRNAGLCTPTGCTCTPTTCQPIKKPTPKPYPISSCFSISAIASSFGQNGVDNQITVDGQCFVGGSTAVVSLTKDVSGLPTTTQHAPIAGDGTFSTTFFLPANASGTYNIWAYDWIGPEWISPMSNQLSLRFL